tara:strand:- start:1770 stop:2519 length:750 start_codon:yes stop_codon:yes gene_type:complete
MKLVFGTTTIEGDDILSLKTSRGRRFNKLHRSSTVTHQWSVTGRIIAANLSALETKMDIVYAMFGDGSNDLKFTTDGGAIISGHSLVAASTKWGVRCTGFKWMPLGRGGVGAGPEYVNRKAYIATFEAQENESESNVVDWTESLTQMGGGFNDTVHQTSMTGLPDPQTLNLYTPIRIVQQGTSVGLESYVPYPAAVYPSHVVSRHTRYNYSSPVYYSVQSELFPSRWTYVSTHQSASDIPAGALAPPTF